MNTNAKKQLEEEIYMTLFLEGLINEAFLRGKVGPAALAAALAAASPAAATSPAAAPVPQVSAAEEEDLSNFFFTDSDLEVEKTMDTNSRLSDDFDPESIMNPAILSRAVDYKYAQDMWDIMVDPKRGPSALPPSIEKNIDKIEDPEFVALIKKEFKRRRGTITGQKHRLDLKHALKTRTGSGGKGEVPTKDQLGGKPLWPEYDPGSMRNYEEGWKRFLNEDPVKRVGDPSYVQRIFQISLKVAIHKKRGGDREQTFTEIRGIPGVTIVTVDSTGTSRDDTYYYSTLNIKFELIRGEAPLYYKNDIFLPGLRKIRGLRVISVGKIIAL